MKLKYTIELYDLGRGDETGIGFSVIPAIEPEISITELDYFIVQLERTLNLVGKPVEHFKITKPVSRNAVAVPTEGGSPDGIHPTTNRVAT